MYRWNVETSAEEEFAIDIPVSGDREYDKKEVDVLVTGKTIRAGIKKQTPALEGTLFMGVQHSMWQFDKKTQTITIHVEKDPTVPWPVIIQGPNAGKIDRQSLFHLGEAHEAGKGYQFAPDGEKALGYYFKSAEANFAPAMVRLAQLFTPGMPKPPAMQGVEPNADTAKSYLEKAADLGDAGAQVQLAYALMEPSTLQGAWPVDQEGAMAWASKAAAQGLADASFLVGSLLEQQDKTKEAVQHYQRAPNHGRSLHRLAMLTAQGAGGLRRDVRAAEALLERAVKVDPTLPRIARADLEKAAGGMLGGVTWDQVGVAVGAVAVLGLCYLFVRRRQQA